METVITITVKETEGELASMKIEANGISVIELIGHLQLAINSTIQTLNAKNGKIERKD